MFINFLIGLGAASSILFTIAAIVFAVSYILSISLESALVYTVLMPMGLISLIMLVAATIQLGSNIRNDME